MQAWCYAVELPAAVVGNHHGSRARVYRAPRVIGRVHAIVESQAGVGNVWSLETLRRWLREKAGVEDSAVLQQYVSVLPEHLTRRFISAKEDGVVVTGRRTGEEPDFEDLQAVREATSLPVLVGSGVTVDNFERFIDLADGFIVGSAFKEGGLWNAPVCEDRVGAIVGVAEHARSVYSAIR